MPILDVAGAKVAFTDTGPPTADPDAPTVVFGHGLLFGGWMFDAQVAALAGTYRCVTIDWRGQGASPPAAGGYDMDTLTDDAAALVAHLDVGAVHWVGLSMGGFVGLRLAARRPDLVRSLVLLDTSADPETRVDAVKDIVLAHVFRLLGIGPVRSQVLPIMFGPAFRADPAGAPAIAEWTQRLERSDRGAIRKAVLGVALRRSIAAEVASITAPTLVVVGADDTPTPPKRARAIVAAVDGARLEVVADCGHSSTVEQPATLSRLIGEFVTGVDAAL